MPTALRSATGYGRSLARAARASISLPATAFRALIPWLGKEIVALEAETLLEALKGAGVAMLSDCRRGECGLCALPILAVDGVVDHRDVFFGDEEEASNAKLCACVSRIACGVDHDRHDGPARTAPRAVRVTSAPPSATMTASPRMKRDAGRHERRLHKLRRSRPRRSGLSTPCARRAFPSRAIGASPRPTPRMRSRRRNAS